MVALAAALAPIMWGSYAVLCAGDVALGVLSGIGRSGAQGVAYLVSIWAIGLPLSIVSARLTGWGLQGLWGALLAGYLVLDAIAFSLVWTTDWEKAAQNAAECAEEAEEGVI